MEESGEDKEGRVESDRSGTSDDDSVEGDEGAELTEGEWGEDDAGTESVGEGEAEIEIEGD